MFLILLIKLLIIIYKQIIGSYVSFVYNYMPRDSQSYITAKYMFNTAHSEMNNPYSKSTLKMHKKYNTKCMHPK